MKPLQRLGAGEGRHSFIARLGQNLFDHILQGVLIVHNQNAIGHTTGLLCLVCYHYTPAFLSVQSRARK